MDRKTILAVDDEPNVLRLVSIILQSEGYQVLEASSGPKALEALRDYPDKIDLLLTDINMAPMSGPELVAAVRKNRYAVPVLYITGYAPSAEVVSLEVQMGLAGLITKPFSPSHFSEVVKRLLA